MTESIRMPMRQGLLAWWTQYRIPLGYWVCTALLCVGLLGILIARSTDQRATTAALLLNLSAVLLLVAATAALACSVAWIVTRKDWARQWTAFGGAVSACMLLAVAGLGAGANALRLESGLRLQVGPDFVFIGGAMPRNLAAQLESLVHPSVPLNRVILSNSGGSVEAAIETAAWLRERGVLRAVVEGDCASACAILALLMAERYLTPGAALGFHDLWGRRASSPELQADRARIFEHLAANGIDTGFVRPLMSGRLLQYPPRPVLLEHRLVTGCWSQALRAPEACTGGLASVPNGRKSAAS